MIAEDVVFVSDNDGNSYYIPKDKLEDWYLDVDTEYFYDSGITPDYATLVEGECFVVDIKEML